LHQPGDEGWLAFLAVVIDLSAAKVVGLVDAADMQATLVIDALEHRPVFATQSRREHTGCSISYAVTHSSANAICQPTSFTTMY